MSVPQTPVHGFKLGKLEPVASGVDEFKAYFPETIPAPPPQAHYGGLVTAPWLMLANGPDSTVTLAGTPPGWGGCGDCVVAGMGHYDLMSNYDDHGATEPTVNANEAVTTYCRLANCTPEELFTDPNTYDTGLNIGTSLQTWHKPGLFGSKIAFEADVNYQNMNDVKNALYLCGGVIIGIQVPESAEEQFPGTWTYVPGSPILGGHCFTLSGYNSAEKMFWGETWGTLIGITEEFLLNYMDEVHAVVSGQAVKAGKSPTGLLIPKWEADLKTL